MAKRFATTNGLFFSEWGAGSTADTVIVEDKQIRNTGLVDAYGTPICSFEESQPAGFVPLRDRSKD